VAQGEPGLVHREFTLEDARRFYDRLGARQDTQGFYENPALDALIEHADFQHTQAVFEFGCGTGALARRLFETVLPGDARYVGLDLSETMVGLATKRLETWRDRAEVRLSDGSPTLPVPDGAFDRFVATYVFDLLGPGSKAQVLAEGLRILRPGGLLCTVALTHGTTPVSRLVSRLWDGICWRWPRLVGGCRPIRLEDDLEPERWEIRHREAVASYGISSEVLVAERRAI
jgi:ubiquinone/menaquinone biosynthesis C-methylase UbiE